MPRLIDVNDIVGQCFGKLKVLAWSHHDGKYHHYKCLCSCGRIKTIKRPHLRPGGTTCCNCFHADTDEGLREIIMRLPPNKNGCRIWAGCKDSNGYGRLAFKGKPRKAHVESARLFIGPRLEKQEVIHKCATPSCCEPTHLMYGSHSKNLELAYRKEGAARSHSKLNMEKARQIRKMYPRMTQKEIAKRFGCSPVHIMNVINNKRWKEPVIKEEDDWSSEGHEQLILNF